MPATACCLTRTDRSMRLWGDAPRSRQARIVGDPMQATAASCLDWLQRVESRAIHSLSSAFVSKARRALIRIGCPARRPTLPDCAPGARSRRPRSRRMARSGFRRTGLLGQTRFSVRPVRPSGTSYASQVAVRSRVSERLPYVLRYYRYLETPRVSSAGPQTERASDAAHQEQTAAQAEASCSRRVKTYDGQSF